MVRVEVEDPVPDLEFTDVDVPLDVIRAVRELADVLDPDGEPVWVFEALIDTEGVPQAVVVFDTPGVFDIVDDPVEVFVVDIEEVVVFVLDIDLVFRGDPVCVLDAAIVLDPYGEDVLVFDGAPEKVPIVVIRDEDVVTAVFVPRRDGARD